MDRYRLVRIASLLMGAWGVGPFENDTAADWLAELSVAVPTTLQITLLSVVAIEPEVYLEEPDASAAVAAAEVVAAMRGHAGPAVLGAPEILKWVRDHSDWLDTELVRQAIAAVYRVRSSSELRDLWSESPELDVWAAQLDDLVLRLKV
jgi:hypothetical protein